MSELTIDPEVYQEKLPDCKVGEKITCAATITEVGEGGVKAEIDPETLAKAPEEEAAPAAESEPDAGMEAPKRTAAVSAVLGKQEGY